MTGLPFTRWVLTPKLAGHPTLYLCQYSDVQFAEISASEVLSTAECEMYQDRGKRKKNEFLASRYIIKSCLNIPRQHWCNTSVLFNAEQEQVTLVCQEHQLHTLSLSHSNHNVAFICNTANANYGVDVQSMKKTRNTRELANSFHPDEIKWVEAHGEGGFYRLWCLKEAYSKLKRQHLLDVLPFNLLDQLESCFIYQNSELTLCALAETIKR